jgi:hypothetical protein
MHAKISVCVLLLLVFSLVSVLTFLNAWLEHIIVQNPEEVDVDVEGGKDEVIFLEQLRVMKNHDIIVDVITN